MNKSVYVTAKAEAKNLHLARYELGSLMLRPLEEDVLRGITTPQHRKSKMGNNAPVVKVSSCLFGLRTRAPHCEIRKRKKEENRSNAL
jgi:hypothetical protein